MISYAGIAIFLFGNKLAGDEIILSNGMREEYEIAQKQGALVIPVGGTGYMAQELWTEVKNRIESGEVSLPKSLKESLLRLGDNRLSLEEIKKIILEIVSNISN